MRSHQLFSSPTPRVASKQPQWQYPRRHAVTGEWAEPALYWQRPPRPMYMHMRKVLANCFKMPMPVVMASGLMTYWLFLQGNTSEDDMKLSRVGNSDFLEEKAFFKYGTYHPAPGMIDAETEAKLAARAAKAAAAAEAAKP